MGKTPKVSDLVRNNPDADESLIKEARSQLRELGKHGAGRQGYDLALPYERRVTVGFSSSEQDSRCVVLTNRQG